MYKYFIVKINDQFEKSIKFVIICFKSDHIINKYLKSIKRDIKVIIVENSKNIFIKQRLKKKFPNIKVLFHDEILLTEEEIKLDYQKVKTKYACNLNPDAYLEKYTLKVLYKV